MVRQSDSGLEGLGSIPRNGGFSFDWALTKGLRGEACMTTLYSVLVP